MRSKITLGSISFQLTVEQAKLLAAALKPTKAQIKPIVEGTNKNSPHSKNRRTFLVREVKKVNPV